MKVKASVKKMCLHCRSVKRRGRLVGYLLRILVINNDKDNMRIAGITIPDEKRLEIALTAVYGVGRPALKSTLDALGIEHGKRAKDLSAKEEAALREKIEKFTIEGELRRSNQRRISDDFAISKRIEELVTPNACPHAASALRQIHVPYEVTSERQ
jgi:ribosomal protein S13/ribosomal protein L36